MTLDFTPIQEDKVNYLRTSLRLQSPDLETDPANKFTDDDLWQILSLVTPIHKPENTIDDIPQTEFYFVTLLAKKEVFYRLATSTAPFYPLSAEGAQLSKNVRFDHYIALVRQVDEDYKTAMELRKQNSGNEGLVQTYEQVSQAKHFTLRNYNLAEKPTVKLTTSNLTQNSVDLDWTKFDKGLFLRYMVFADKEPIIDEYLENPLRGNVQSKFYTTDIHRLKYRLYGLEPNTKYYVAVLSEDRNGLYGYAQVEFTTPPIM